MPLALQFEAAPRLVLARLSGRVDKANILTALEAVYDDPRWSPAHVALWDVRGITSLVLDLAEMDEILDFVRARRGHITSSGVISGTFITELIATLLGRLLRDTIPNIGLFKSPEAAAKWARLPADALPLVTA